MRDIHQLAPTRRLTTRQNAKNVGFCMETTLEVQGEQQEKHAVQKRGAQLSYLSRNFQTTSQLVNDRPTYIRGHYPSGLIRMLRKHKKKHHGEGTELHNVG